MVGGPCGGAGLRLEAREGGQSGVKRAETWPKRLIFLDFPWFFWAFLGFLELFEAFAQVDRLLKWDHSNDSTRREAKRRSQSTYLLYAAYGSFTYGLMDV